MNLIEARKANFPNRRKLEVISENGSEKTVDVLRDDATEGVTNPGTPVTANLLNTMITKIQALEAHLQDTNAHTVVSNSITIGAFKISQTADGKLGFYNVLSGNEKLLLTLDADGNLDLIS